MPQYQVFAFCEECKQPHPAGVWMMMENPNLGYKSVAEVYSGDKLPMTVLMVKNNRLKCPNSGKKFTQTNDNQIFLIACAN